LPYPNLVRERTRHGRECYYFRPWHGSRIRIRETIDTEEFELRYKALVAQQTLAKRKPSAPTQATPNTFRWLGIQYTTSTRFTDELDPGTQHTHRQIFESMYLEPIAPGGQEVFADCPLDRFDARAIAILRDRKKTTPEAANMRLKRLRAMFKWAMQPENAHLGVTSNPAREVAKLKPKRKGGFAVWTPEDLDKFEAHHPIGSKARLALALLMFTGARRSDVMRLGPPMVRDGTLTWLPFKGRNRESAVEMNIPVIPDLRAIIDGTPVVGTTTFLVTHYGRPFTKEGFGNKMADWCREAGIGGKNSHACARLRLPGRQIAAPALTP